MAAHPHTDEALIAVAQSLKIHGTQVAAAHALGISRTTFQCRLREAQRRGLVGDIAPKQDDSLTGLVESLRAELETTRQSLAEATRPKFTVRQDIYGETSTLRVLAIGDAHNSPKITDRRRFVWAGQYAAEVKHDVVVSIGDWDDFLSLCFHVPDENYSGRAKPSYLADIAASKESHDAFNDGLGSWTPEKHKTLGNHENRIYRVEDSAPQSVGMYHSLYDEVMRGAGWTYSPYGATTFYGGVGFTHVPLSIMGKPLGGKTVLTSLGRDSVYDSVTGHTHVPGRLVTRKIGQRHITAVDTGCFLPYGMVEDYAQHTMGGWDWGLTDLTIKNRQIVSYKWVSMLELEERYGQRNAA